MWLTAPSQDADDAVDGDGLSSSPLEDEPERRVVPVPPQRLVRRGPQRSPPPSSTSASKYQIDTIYESLAEAVVYEEKTQTVSVRETKEMLIRQTREELIKTIQQQQQLKQQQQQLQQVFFLTRFVHMSSG